MSTRPLTNDQEASSTTVMAAAGVQQLVRRLIRQVTNPDQPSALCRVDGDTREVILDVEVDGLRCLLVRPPPQTSRAKVVLSPREQEIARMVAKGYPNKSIAAVLDISSWTVCTHLRRIFAKLSVGSRAAMVARLIEEDLIGKQL
jgi:two-component system, NarL family, nitrate/nitrite response regulator NarL